jgi:glycogen debranching enzyme
MIPSIVSVLRGNTFVVSNGNGDFESSPSEPHGLFHRDTRFLSQLRLTLDGSPLHPLSTDDLAYYSAQFFLVPGSDSAYTDATVSVRRQRAVGPGGFQEEMTVMNHSPDTLPIEIRLELDADFADLFEVKDASIEKPGTGYKRVDDDRLVLGYRRDAYVRETWIRPMALAPGSRRAGSRSRPRSPGMVSGTAGSRW